MLTDTTGFPGAAQLASSLAKAGCEISAVCPVSQYPLAKVGAIRERFSYSSLAPLDSLIAAIERAQPQIIIPCDEAAVQHLHELHKHADRLEPSLTDFTSLIERSLGSPQGYPIVHSRYDFLKLAREEGLRVPETSLIYTVDTLKTCRIDEAHPLVLKADGSWGGNGVRIAHTPQQARNFFSELSRPLGLLAALKQLLLSRNRFCLRRWYMGATPEIVAQAYISGRPANCAAFSWEGRVLACISVEVVSSRKRHGPASIVRVIDHPEMLAAAERIARRLQMSGFFGLDFMMEASTGTPYLIEINPRCTRLSHLQLGKGRDMVAALRAQLTGEPLQERPSVTQNLVIAYFPDACFGNSEVLSQCFYDTPRDEPALIRQLLKDSSDRTSLGRLVDRLRRLRAAEGARADEVPVEFPDLIPTMPAKIVQTSRGQRTAIDGIQSA